MLRISCVILILLLTCCENDTVVKDFYVTEVGHIYVPLQCNGVEMYGLFDTGAPCMVVVDSLFDRFELEKEDTTIQISFPNTSSQWFRSTRSKPVYVYMDDLKARQKLSFFTKSNMITFSTPLILGLELIEQFHWLFDFTTMKVTISENELAFDAKNSVKLVYYKTDGLYICCDLKLNKSIRRREDGNIILDKILIDTGGGAMEAMDTIFKTYLAVRNQVYNNSFYWRDKEIKDLVFLPNELEDIFLERDSSSILEYNGFTWIKEISDDSTYNGRLSLGYIGIYKQMYINTDEQVIYLKK